MSYVIKEVFPTLQGEGAHTGRAAVFCRFSRCNLWNGREAGRADARCRFCDTDFVGTDGPGGGRFATPGALADHVRSMWEANTGTAPSALAPGFVVCTGGEPLLQLDRALVDALHDRHLEVAVETNGTLPAPDGLDWVCVSPKAGTELALTSGDELKLIYPQPGAPPEAFEALAFDRFWLQPMDGPDRDANTAAAIRHCLANPRWRLSVQTHKYIGID